MTVFAEAVAVIFFRVPACVTEKFCVNTPAVNALEVAGLIVPAFVVIAAVETKLVTVLLFTSCAVIVTEKAVPAVCGDEIVLNAK